MSPPAPRGGAGRVVAAGLLGGLVGAGLTYGAEHLRGRPDAGLGDRLTALEKRIGSTPTVSLEPRIAALEGGLRQAGDDARAARTAAEAAAKQAAEALNRPVTAQDPGVRETLTSLSNRADEGAKQAGANAAAIGDLGRQVAELSTRTDQGLAASASGIQAVQTALQTMRTDVAGVLAGTTGLQGRADETDKRLATVSENLARVSGDLAKLSPAAVQAGLRIVVAGRLDDSLRAGTPLGPALAALGKLGAEPAALAALTPFADTAPPGAGPLLAEFKPLADQMTAAPAPASESWTDRLRRLFGKVVSVRAVGDGSGTDLPGLVARIEAALARASLGEAARLWEQLPDPAKRISSDWAGRLKARVAAEDASRRLVAQALSALDATTR